MQPGNPAIRSAIRAFMLTSSLAECEREKQISLERGDMFRAACIDEIIAELMTEGEQC